MKKTALFLVGILLLSLVLPALADTNLSYEGVVVAGETLPVTAPYGGLVTSLSVRKGDTVREGDVIARIEPTSVYAPVEGTVSGIYALAGDSTETASERYGAVLWIEPLNRYVLAATFDKAYNASENHYVHLGEKVYLSCVKDGTHQGEGFVSALTESGYSVEVTSGEFYMEESVNICRQADYSIESRIGRGTVERAKPIAVKGSGSLLAMHVNNGDTVERGQLLFDTVEGALDGLYAPSGDLLSPVSGIVMELDKAAGASVAKGETVVRICPFTSVLAEFSIPEADLFSLQPGQEAELEYYWATDRPKDTGRIVSISHVSDEDKEGTIKKTYTSYCTLTPEEWIRLGMTVLIYPKTAEAPEIPDTETQEMPEEETLREP